LHQVVVDEVGKAAECVTQQSKEDDIFGDLVEEEGIKTLEGISFDIAVKQIYFDDFDEYNETETRWVVFSVIQSQLQESKD